MKKRVSWQVEQRDGYVRVIHSARGLICAGVYRNGQISDVAFIRPEDQRCNMIRQPAMVALARWERGQS